MKYHADPYFQSDGLFSSHHNVDFYKKKNHRHHRLGNATFPKEPKVEFFPFYGKEH